VLIVNIIGRLQRKRAVDFMAKHEYSNHMGSIIIRDIENEVRKQFRLLCIQNNTNMNQVLREYIKRVVETGKFK